MKILKKIAITLLIAFIAIQFARPERNTSQGLHTLNFIAETNPSKEIKVILEKACFDCHSNNTQYPWYNDVAPISFWMSHHIKEGKAELNFSDWKNYSSKKKAHKLEELIEVIEEEEMPLKEYMWLHEEATLTNLEKELLLKWAKQTNALYLLKNLPK